MPRIQPLDPAKATGAAKRLLEDVQERWGMIPNMVRTMAKAPAVLEGYLSAHTALNNGVLPARLREQIAMTVAEANNSHYCLSAHAAIGKTLGLSADVILDSRRGTSPDTKTEAVLRFARELVENRGWVGDGDIYQLRRAGYGDQEIVEIIAHVALSMFTNYFNHVVNTELDFPAAAELARA